MNEKLLLSRRALIGRATMLAGMALVPPMLGACVSTRANLGGYPFTLGVASGEPTGDGVVLWTRLAPRPLDPDGGMGTASADVAWTLYEDAGLTRVVRSGRARADAAFGHSVHVELSGLSPDRPYWYRFVAGGEASPVGRTRTAPALGAAVDRLRACFASCQKYEAGHYAAYRHMVEEAPDIVLFLGDYIYEGDPGSREAVRLHQNPEPIDVAGYRQRYATYKSDPLLQAAHAAAPWVTMWDDHEVVNDYGADRDPEGGDQAAFLKRRAAAYQAYYEHMPLRRSSLPVGPSMSLYRTLDWGALAQFQLIDDRQYRDPRPCGGETGGKLIADCDDRRAPARSLLGKAQEDWLMRTLADSNARWNVLTQQTLFGPMELRDPETMREMRYSSDGWDGYPATRSRIVNRWQEARVSNPLVIGGDIHSFAAGDVHADDDGAVVASEFVGGSISSLGMDGAIAKRIQGLNPRLKTFDSTRRGYGRIDIMSARSEFVFQSIDDARVPGSGRSTLAAYAVEHGRPGLQSL